MTNRIAGDDNELALVSPALRPPARPQFGLDALPPARPQFGLDALHAVRGER